MERINMQTTSDQNEVKGSFGRRFKKWKQVIDDPLLKGPRAAFFPLLLLLFGVSYFHGSGHAIQVYILGNIFFLLLGMYEYILERDKKEKDKE